MESLSVTKHKVVLVPFPFDDLSSSKVRPAVCLTNPIGPHRHVYTAAQVDAYLYAGVQRRHSCESGNPHGAFIAPGCQLSLA